MDMITIEKELGELVIEYGERPYDFFSILVPSAIPNMDIQTQNERWEFVKSESWHGLDLSGYLLWAISDNGDLLWWNGSQTIAMDHRSSRFVSEPTRPRQFMRLVGMGKIGRIFPKSIENEK